MSGPGKGDGPPGKGDSSDARPAEGRSRPRVGSSSRGSSPPRGADPLGRSALFWMSVPSSGGSGLSSSPARSRSQRSVGKEALFSGRLSRSSRAGEKGEHAPRETAPDGETPRMSTPWSSWPTYPLAALKGTAGALCSWLSSSEVALQCSSCDEETPVSPLSFVSLQVPLFLWLPKFSSFDHRLTLRHFMVCPACGRRTWVVARWRPPRPAREMRE